MTGKVVYSGGAAAGTQRWSIHVDEEITGTINGDVLRARSTSGLIQVELTVAGTEMAGPGSANGAPAQFVLRQPDAAR